MIDLYYKLEHDPTCSGVTWLVIVPEAAEAAQDDDGYVLLLQFGEEGNTPFCYDDFCFTLDEAFNSAKHQYGVVRDSWHTGDFYKEKGIELPS